LLGEKLLQRAEQSPIFAVMYQELRWRSVF
jgi:hypothetical protein